MKREESEYAISCNPDYGPCFGYETYYGYDLFVNDHCNKKNSCYIRNDGRRGYECHPQYKCSLFVNTGEPDETNDFIVLDYEVFGIDYEDKYTIDHSCKYSDIIWEYIETKDISEESLKQIGNKTELLKDLNAIHCDDKKPTLVVIKSSGGWIFGRYTTQSWSGRGIYCYNMMIINR